jgi:Phosphatidylglycerophosphate synthase
MMKLRYKIHTIPNYLSFARLILAPFIGHYLYWENKTFAIVLIIIAYSLDALDGIVARHFGQESEFGKIIDPIADKVMYAFIALALLMKGLVPIWFFALYILRDLLILLGGLLFAKKVKEIPKSNKWGKISAFSVAISLFGIIINIPYFNPYALIFALILSYFSTYIYFKVGYNQIKN